MKRLPILKAKFQGCMSCSTIPKTTLMDKDKIRNYAFISLCVNGVYTHVDDITIAEFLKQTTIKEDDCVEIFYMSAYHDETYELDTADMVFKLVEQGRGYA